MADILYKRGKHYATEIAKYKAQLKGEKNSEMRKVLQGCIKNAQKKLKDLAKK